MQAIWHMWHCFVSIMIQGLRVRNHRNHFSFQLLESFDLLCRLPTNLFFTGVVFSSQRNDRVQAILDPYSFMHRLVFVPSLSSQNWLTIGFLVYCRKRWMFIYLFWVGRRGFIPFVLHWNSQRKESSNQQQIRRRFWSWKIAAWEPSPNFGTWGNKRANHWN